MVTMKSSERGEGVPAAARRFLSATLAAAAVALGFVAFLATSSPLTWASLAPLAAVAAASFALQRRAFIMHWQGQRIAMTLDEAVLLVGFLVAPPAHAVLALVAGVVAAQLASRRARVKAAYNVAAYGLAACATLAAVLGLSALGTPKPLAFVAGAFAYTFASNVLISHLFARLESGSATRIFRTRFAIATVTNAGLGIAFAMSAWALWLFHPLATLALVPFVALPSLLAGALTRLDREARIRERLATATRALLASPDASALAEQILHECGELFLAGRAELRVEAGLDREARAWSAEFEGGADPLAAPIEAPLVGREGGRLGTLRVFPARRAPTAKDARLDAPLLTLFAAEAAAALEMASVVRRYASLHTMHDRIVRHAPAGIVRLDAGGRLAEHNDAFERAVGHPREAWALLLAEPMFAEGIARLMRGVGFQEMEIRLNGAVFDVAGVPLPANEGEMRVGSIVLFRDVSARHEAAEAQRKHSVTRPLVRRIVLEIVREGAVSERLLVSLGHQLAKEVDAQDPEGYARAFREMGLGDLRADSGPDGLVSFVADDLLERRPRAKQPTCHLTRGYVEGVVEALEGHPALGSEVRCQSQGHASCQFYVKAKPVALQPRAATKVTFGK